MHSHAPTTDHPRSSKVGIQISDPVMFAWSLFLIVYPVVRISAAFTNDAVILSLPLWLMPIVGIFAFRLSLIREGKQDD